MKNARTFRGGRPAIRQKPLSGAGRGGLSGWNSGPPPCFSGNPAACGVGRPSSAIHGASGCLSCAPKNVRSGWHGAWEGMRKQPLCNRPVSWPGAGLTSQMAGGYRKRRNGAMAFDRSRPRLGGDPCPGERGRRQAQLLRLAVQASIN